MKTSTKLAKRNTAALAAAQPENAGVEILTSASSKFDEHALFSRVAQIIETRTQRAGSYANREITLMYWEIGKYVGEVLLKNERAEYGTKIVATLGRQLVERYGKCFTKRNLYQMVQFSIVYPDAEIVHTLCSQLSWSHFRELMRLEDPKAREHYANDAIARRLGVREMTRQIARKAYERREIAEATMELQSKLPFNPFMDPVMLDTLGLKNHYLEADLENAIITGLESFILEFGQGFTFVERQKRITMGGDDFYLDLLFYHRDLRRLVAVELKIGKFVPRDEGQMRFYLKWLDRHERREGEGEPIGLILCSQADRGQVELMELGKSGIAVAEYWTRLPPKALLEEKIQSILHEARERLARRKSLPRGGGQKQIEYFYEPEGDD